MMNIVSRVFNNKMSSEIALLWEDKEIRYRELKNYIYSFSKMLQKNGVKERDRVGIFMANCPEFIISFFSILNIGATVVLIDNMLNDEIAHIILESKISVTITNDKGKDRIIKILNNCNNYIIHKPRFILNILCMKNSIDIDNCEVGFDSLDNNQEAVIIYTSGSSGKPKGIINTHRTIVEALNNYLDTVNINKEDVLMAVSPFFHSYGMGSVMLAGLASRAKLILHTNFQPRLILESIKKNNVTIFHGVPYMYELLGQYIVDKKEIEHVRLFISAGAKLSEKIMDNFIKLGKVIHQEYGSSESGTIAINLSNSIKKILSVGQPLKNVNIKIEDGDIFIKSKGCSIGYLNKAFENNDGWYNTGDVGFVDNDGYVYIEGRSKNIINIGGKKTNIEEISEVLCCHPLIEAAVVKPYENIYLGESIEAIIQTSSSKLSVDEVIGFCSKYLATYKLPTKISFKKKLQCSGNGKILNDN